MILQLVQNAAAHLLTNTPKHDHITLSCILYTALQLNAEFILNFYCLF